MKRPTHNPSEEGSKRAGARRQFPFREGAGADSSTREFEHLNNLRTS